MNRDDDGGSAIIEFVFVAVIVLVPLVYLIAAVATVQRTQVAVTQAARDAGALPARRRRPGRPRRQRLRVVPRQLEGDEREHAWRAFVAMYPQAEHYVRFTDRALPLVALEPGP